MSKRYLGSISSARKRVMAELTVPWDEHMEAAHERKKKNNGELSAACKQNGRHPPNRWKWL